MKKISWWEPKLLDKEKEYLERVFEKDFPNEGVLATEFENKVKKLVGSKHAVVLSNGTSGMFCSLKALNIGPGDEVLVPDATFVATANAVEMTGAKPVLVDIDETLCIDIVSLRKSITTKTKAIIPVCVSGKGPKMKEICEIAIEKDLHIIEDSCEAFVSKYKNKFLGTYGITGIFSFSPFKTITTGQGGMIVTDNDELHTRLRELKDQGRPSRGTGGDDIHASIGYNFKFTDLQAAIGLGQLHYLNERQNRMVKNYKLYNTLLDDIKSARIIKFDVDNGEIPQWTTAVFENRELLLNQMIKNGIDARKFWHPIHTQKPYKLPDSNFPNSINLMPKSLWLPSGFTLSDEDIMYVADVIKEHINTN